MSSIFTIHKRDRASKARIGLLNLPHGQVKTPAFMPVGTNGTVKALHHETVEQIGYNMILGNTYHLYLRPGMEVIEHYGGLHAFSSWPHNILTDSGGFQIFSLSSFRKIKEEGVTFRSHIDGSYHTLTPEKVVDIQRILGSDIQMCLDVCTPPDISREESNKAMQITHNWALRAKNQWEASDDTYQGKLFGIVQGNFFTDLRKESARFISELDLPGIAIGGLSVGETFSQYSDFLAYTCEQIPENKPLYVMGIGTPSYILEAVEQGVDLFDCVFATRTARNGAVFTDQGMINLKKVIHEFDTGPIVPGCTCHACRVYSRGYLRHLFKTNEILGSMLATEHNLTYLFTLVQRIRESIEQGNFLQFKHEYLAAYERK
ncbi:MAG: tRNA guanosine(34) transglycosylase Tgt [Spirochaetota bacterium]